MSPSTAAPSTRPGRSPPRSPDPPSIAKGSLMTIDHNTTEPEQPDSTPAGETVPAGPAEQAPPWRAMMPVSQLAAHPGNVRTDLDLNEEFVASIAANGVLVPLRITPDPGGAYRVIDGHRRLAAAARAGLVEVPVDVAGERATDEPGQRRGSSLRRRRE